VKRLAKNKKGCVVCILSYWIYAGPGCIIIVHYLPLTTVGVCVDPVGVGQVYAGGVDGNIHVTLVSSLVMNIVGGGIAAHSSVKTRTASSPALKSIVRE
jgi:hypothetical protein